METFMECSVKVLCPKMFPKCSRETFQERSLRMFSKSSCRRFSQYSFWTLLKCWTGTFREHCLGTLKKPGNFLSSRNIPWKCSWNVQGRNCAMGALCLYISSWMFEYYTLKIKSDNKWKIAILHLFINHKPQVCKCE